MSWVYTVEYSDVVEPFDGWLPVAKSTALLVNATAMYWLNLHVDRV